MLKLYKTSMATSSVGDGDEPEGLAVLPSADEPRMTCCVIVYELMS